MCKLKATKIVVERVFRNAPYEAIKFQLECQIIEDKEIYQQDINQAFNRVLTTIERSYYEITTAKQQQQQQ